jgi:hypothetical protein
VENFLFAASGKKKSHLEGEDEEEKKKRANVFFARIL